MSDERLVVAEGDLVPEDDRIIGVAFRWSLLGIVLIGAIVGAIVLLRREPADVTNVIERGVVEAPPKHVQDAAAMPEIVFTDVTREAGIDFVHYSSAAGEKLLPETMGGGCAFFDYDGDGDQDLLFTTGSAWDHISLVGGEPTPALYRNDGRGHFDNVTAAAGLGVSLYGMGVAIGDYDRDGDDDVYLSALGPNVLLRNDGGTFTDVTTAAGVAGEPDAWSTSTGFFDLENDGDLDLFVCNYVRWSREIDLAQNFTLDGVHRAYGPPLNFQGAHCALYRNEGDSTFTDISETSGIRIVNPATGNAMAKALGVTFADVDRDGLLDVLVANDTVQKFLFRNRGDGTFTELGAAAGFAFDSTGQATGAMGIDAAEYAGNGRLAIGIGNFANEATSFYVQQPRDPWQFADMADAEGIGPASRLRLKFGLFFFDYDLDGRLDLFQANGHLDEEISAVHPSQTYAQSAQLFWNCGSEARTCYAAVPDEKLGDLAKKLVGRGAAFADIDLDGDLDLVIAQTGGSPLLLRNDQATQHAWVRIRLVGTRSNTDAIGARVELDAGAFTQARVVMPTRSYLSQVELPVTFGLGEAKAIDRVRISWPSGEVQVIERMEPNREHVIREPDVSAAS